MNLGEFNDLIVERFSPHGAYLSDGNNEVLLPKKFVSGDLKIGDKIRVFVYMDHETRPVATTQTPYALNGQIAALAVRSTVPNGCYLDIGLDKDIFMPSKNPARFTPGERVVVRIGLDKQSRLIAKLGIKEALKPAKNLPKFSKVSILPFEKTPLGVGCVVDSAHFGLLFYNEIFCALPLGVPATAYVKQVRSDGKIDLSLKAQNSVGILGEAILQRLAQNGEISLNYDSSPESIKAAFGVSKKEFKRALTALVAAKKIALENGKIRAI